MNPSSILEYVAWQKQSKRAQDRASEEPFKADNS